jgi:hypothetical protein
MTRHGNESHRDFAALDPFRQSGGSDFGNVPVNDAGVLIENNESLRVLCG